MIKKYDIGYIFEESELPNVAEYCNTQQFLMTDSYDIIKKEIKENDEVKEVEVRRFIIKEIPTEILENQKRNKRNYYLEKYIDPVVTNPLRWEDLSDKEKQVYKDYRKYLLDYTETENWWKANPLTLDEWKDK